MRSIALLALAGSLIAVPDGSYGYGLGKIADDELAATSERAAQYLLALQLEDGAWPWDEARATKRDNYGGIVGESLLAAYEQTGDPSLLEAAQRYADELVARFRRSPEARPFKPDIEFLVRVTEVSGALGYGETAREWFQVVKRGAPTGGDEVDRILTGREPISDITGYDVALAIRAALAVEEYGYARELGDAVVARMAEWLKEPASAYGTVSQAALIDALYVADAERFAAPLTRLSQLLIAQQDDNGAWCLNETQATAYAVRALARYDDGEARRAAQRGVEWLAATLLDRGAWAEYHDGFPEPFVGGVISEVQAEALTAVIISGSR